MAFDMLSSMFGSKSSPEPQAPSEDPAQSHESALALVKAATISNPTLLSLKDLIETDGAGAWPPRATHGETWPAPLRQYHDIYLAAAPFLSTEDVSADDEVNKSRVESFRERVSSALKEKVDLDAVKSILSATETNNGNEPSFPTAAYNGFASCISNLRHAYRWGVIPVVRIAQEEKIISFPEELTLPWPFVSRRYGVTSQGGNLMTNYFCNFDQQDRIVYQINPCLSESIRSAEYHFAFMLVRIERLALPIYTEMTLATSHFNRGDKKACLASLKRINSLFPSPLKIFYKTLVDTTISPKVWMHYVQGPTGWGAGEMINGEYVEYDGLSGSHIPFFRIADAFLGIKAYFDLESSRKYIPEGQRVFCKKMRDDCIREAAQENGDLEIVQVLEGIVKQLKTFRAAHRSRIHKYLSTPAPERLIMTAGKSVLESEEIPEIETAIKHLDGILAKRISETK